ncbi:hypothetical protein AAZX31_10G106200 [Glycine max]
MVGRVLMLLNEGISPSNILAMTFTTAAASEMRERIEAIVGKATAKELTISTFHSFSLQLCRSHGENLDQTYYMTNETAHHDLKIKERKGKKELKDKDR